MKLIKYALLLLVVAALYTSCSTSKEGRGMKKTINGEWILQTINVEGINEKFAATIFNEANLNCFVGSSWNFVSNNGSGSYKLVGGTDGCSTLQRSIRWTIYEPKEQPREFQFKRLDDKNNPLDDNNGFRLSVTALTGSTMQLKSAITLDQKPGNIVYNFIKK